MDWQLREVNVMVPNFSIPVSGLQQAGWELDKIAHRIASQNQGARSNEEKAAGGVGLDPAAELTLMAQVENTAEANMRAISTQDEVTKSMLDMFA